MEISLKTREVKETSSASHPTVQHRGTSIPMLAGPGASAIGDINQCVVVTICCSYAEPGAALGEDAPM